MGLLRTLLIGVLATAVAWMWYPGHFDADMVKGKKVIVTGASAGIGEELAYEYARLGAEVVIVARSKDKLEKVAARCTELGAKMAHVLSADLSTSDDSYYEKVVQDALKLLGGRLDTLVLNHIITTGTVESAGWLAKRDMKKLRWMFEINTFSYFSLAAAAMDELEKTAGNLIVVGSAAGVMGTPWATAYSATKHALFGFFDSLRLEQIIQNKKTSITTCVLGSIDTESNRQSDLAQIVERANVNDCAKSIIQGGALGVRTVYYPFDQTYPITALSGFTSVVDNIMIFFFKTS